VPDTRQEEVLAKLLGNQADINNGLKTLTDQVKDVAAKQKAFEGVEPKNVIERIAKNEAGLQRVQAQIRNNRGGGLFVPGLEDEGEAEKFSMLRAMLLVRLNAWNDKKYGFEAEVMKAVREKAAVSGVDSDGGFFVPDQVIPDVIQAIYTTSRFISLDGEGSTRCSVLDGLTGSPVKIPKFEGGALGYWIGENDAYIESKAKTGTVSLQPRKLGVLMSITDEMRRFQGMGFESLLRRDMVRAAAKLLDWTVPYGNGTDNTPRGIFGMKGINLFSAELAGLYSVTDLPDASGAELTFDVLDEMMGVLEDQDIDIGADFAFMFHPRIVRRLRQSKVANYIGQTVEQEYLLGAPLLSDAALRSLMGDFDKTTQLKTAQLPGQSAGWATTSTEQEFTDVVGANWNDVLVGRWSGVEIVPGQSGDDFIRDVERVKLRLYADVQHRLEKGIVVCPDARVRGDRVRDVEGT
jgi:HK97 family phage major capsid protein